MMAVDPMAGSFVDGHLDMSLPWELLLLLNSMFSNN